MSYPACPNTVTATLTNTDGAPTGFAVITKNVVDNTFEVTISSSFAADLNTIGNTYGF